MARLILTVQSPPAAHPVLPLAADVADVTFTPAGASFIDGAQYPLTGREVLLVRNANIAAQTVTIDSVLSDLNRSGDIAAYSIGIGEIAVFWVNRTEGWRQADGNLYFAGSAADVEFAVIRLPQ